MFFIVPVYIPNYVISKNSSLTSSESKKPYYRVPVKYYFFY